MADSYVAVSGSIGAGKSTLIPELAARLSAEPALERPADNPWFTRAALEEARWTFHAQLFFLMDSAAQLVAIRPSRTCLVQERFPDEHVHVMARLQQALGRLSADEGLLLELSLSVLKSVCPPPNAVIWLQASPEQLLSRIRRRGRDEEAEVSLEVLKILEDLYASFFGRWRSAPVLEVDAGDSGFGDNESVGKIVEWLRVVL